MEFVLNTNHRPYRQQITPNTVEQDLIAAIKNREGLNRVQGLIEEGADISSLCDGHWTPLTLAAYLGQTDVVKYLLDIIKQKSCPVKDRPGARSKWRCTVDSVNDSGITPLICASQKGHIDICQLLLQAGANINCKSQHSGQTALLVAVDNKQFSVVELLLEWGADVQMTDNVGITPLYMAVDSNCCPIVKLLIEAGCDVNIGSQDHAPLFLAARRGFLPVVQMLCEAGCNKNVANKYGVTPLYEAALKGRNTVVEYLIEKGCDVNIVDMYNVSPLQVAAMAGNREVVEVLLRGGAYVKWRDSQGRCAMQLAVEMGKASVLECFLMHGVNISKHPALTKRISTVMSVFSHGYLSAAIILLRGCADLDLSDLTDLNLAREHAEVLELLLASGLTHPPSLLLQRSAHLHSSFSPSCRRWLQEYHSQPLSLKSLARGRIRSCLGNTILYSAPKLPLPSFIIDYITYAMI